jgi:hypothetical protein
MIFSRQLVGPLLACVLSVGACGGHSRSGPAETTLSVGGATGESLRGEDCVPYNDTCPAGSYCQYLDGRTQCVTAGDVARDELCNDGARCQRGSICLYGGDLYGDSCQQPCPLDKPRPCQNGRHTCFVAVGPEGEPLPFGVCRY